MVPSNDRAIAAQEDDDDWVVKNSRDFRESISTVSSDTLINGRSHLLYETLANRQAVSVLKGLSGICLATAPFKST